MANEQARVAELDEWASNDVPDDEWAPVRVGTWRAARSTDHEHHWTDADDDETGWHCRICGLTEYPGMADELTPNEAHGDAARAHAAEAGELDVALLWEVLEGFGVIANGTWVSFQREDAEAIAHEYALRRYARLAAASAEPPEEGA